VADRVYVGVCRGCVCPEGLVHGEGVSNERVCSELSVGTERV